MVTVTGLKRRLCCCFGFDLCFGNHAIKPLSFLLDTISRESFQNRVKWVWLSLERLLNTEQVIV